MYVRCTAREWRVFGPTKAQTRKVLALISPTAYSKNYHFWQKKLRPTARAPTRIASRGAPQARKQAIWGDLGPYSTKAASKVASHEVVLRSVGLLLRVPGEPRHACAAARSSWIRVGPRRAPRRPPTNPFSAATQQWRALLFGCGERRSEWRARCGARPSAPTKKATERKPS